MIREATQVSSDECARELLEVVPLIMRAIRSEMRSHRPPDLSVPQFRTLNFLDHHEGASLSDVAEHIGLTLPSMSALIDGLVARQLAIRQVSPTDRRRVTLAPTAQGKTTLEAVRQSTQARLAEVLAALSPSQRATIVQAMEILQPIFTPGGKTGMERSR